MGDPIALVLGLKDLLPEAAVIGPGIHHPVKQARCPDGVLPGLDEELKEGAIAGQKREACH